MDKSLTKIINHQNEQGGSMKRGLVIIALVVTMVAAFGVANSFAVCTQYGKIIYTSGSNTSTTYYIAPRTTFPTYYYYFSTSDPDVEAGLAAAVANHDTVYMYGSAASCPTTGTTRYGGVISSYGIYHNY